MKLIVIIPAYNEEATIGKVISEVPKIIAGLEQIEIFVINDGSTDNTGAVAKSAGVEKVFNSKINLGLAAAFQKGMDEALRHGADIIVNTDADGQYNQKEIPRLIKPILDQSADIVIGNRQVAGLKFMHPGNKYGNILGSWLLRWLTKTNVIDASSGFRAFSRQAALKLNIYSGHTYTHDTIIQAKAKKLTIANVPIEFRQRISGQSKLIKNIFSHITVSLLVILRLILVYRPLKTLFFIGVTVMLPGIFFGLRFIYFYFIGQGDGLIQSLILSAILIIIGFNLIILGFIGDVISVNRKLSEDILYRLKKDNK